MQEIPGPERSPDAVGQALLVIDMAMVEIIRVVDEAGLGNNNVPKKEELVQKTRELSSVYFANINDVLSQIAIALGPQKKDMSAEVVASLAHAVLVLLRNVELILEQDSLTNETRASLEKLKKGSIESLSGFLKKRTYERS